MKVLIVDDSGTMRAIEKRCFIKLGIAEADITEAENGQKALDVFRSEAFDVVLTDWNMPVMDGLQLVKEIRASDAKVPVLMVTTEAERERVVSAIQAGVSDYLVKPFTPGDLEAKIKKCVPAHA